MSKQTYTTFDIAKLLDVYPTTVANWIDNSKLKAFNTPGGHRRVMADDLAAFMRHHNMPIPGELRSNRTKILVVDDDQAVLKSISSFLLLQDEPYEVFTAADGFAAGQAVVQHRPDLVLLDIKLPGIDGIKVCEQIKGQYPATKVVAITGYATQENQDRMTKAGADAFLSKPFRMKAMLAVVRELLPVKQRQRKRDLPAMDSCASGG
jgi:two-component system OmpR family response regulator